jgi:hypothetical protein
LVGSNILSKIRSGVILPKNFSIAKKKVALFRRLVKLKEYNYRVLALTSLTLGLFLFGSVSPIQ